jgi:hypothetical protein
MVSATRDNCAEEWYSFPQNGTQGLERDGEFIRFIRGAKYPDGSKKRALADEASKPPSGHPARTELVWEGKYDADGRRVPPLRVGLPFQTIETVNESVQERQLSLENFARSKTE